MIHMDDAKIFFRNDHVKTFLFEGLDFVRHERDDKTVIWDLVWCFPTSRMLWSRPAQICIERRIGHSRHSGKSFPRTYAQKSHFRSLFFVYTTMNIVSSEWFLSCKALSNHLLQGSWSTWMTSTVLCYAASKVVLAAQKLDGIPLEACISNG